MMLSILGAAVLASTTLASPPATGFTIRQPHRPNTVRGRSPNAVTSNVVELDRRDGPSVSSMYLQTIRRNTAVDGIYSRYESGNASLSSIESGSVFLAPITIGGQSFNMVVDTGSSDTWVVLPDFLCVNPETGAEQSQADCYFAAVYNPSPTFNEIPDENFNITYADGEALGGIMAYEDVTFGGITVSQQEIGLVELAAWYGDSFSSGLVGLAYPYLTNAYAGDDPTQDDLQADVPYEPLFTSMSSRNLTLPIFSLALNRQASVSGGFLAIGGIPNIPHDPYFASTPITIAGINTTDGLPIHDFYAITLDGWAYSNDSSTQFNPVPSSRLGKFQKPVAYSGTQALVDSGTSLIYAPDPVAAAVAALYSPPATYDAGQGLYFVSCAARPPVFGVDIAFKIFYVNAADLIVPYGAHTCVTGVQPDLGGFTIIGDVFLRNVLAVFDVGAAEVRFAAREYTGV